MKRAGCRKDQNLFYADEREICHETEVTSGTEQFVLVSTECNGYRNNPSAPDPLLDQVKLPEFFEVDYVRVFDEAWSSTYSI